MQKHLLTLPVLCVFLSGSMVLGAPNDDFYEANLSLSRATRQEKEGDFKSALESSKKAVQLLQDLKNPTPEWNPEWVDGKLKTATQLQQRIEPLAQKAADIKKADYSLKPGEQRDFTLQRAYRAHQQQKLVVPSEAAVRTPVSEGKKGQEVILVHPRIENPVAKPPVPPVKIKTVPVRPPLPRSDRRFRIGS